MIKKLVWRIFWILSVVLIGIVSIFLIFHSFKAKSKEKPRNELGHFKPSEKPSGTPSYEESKGNKGVGLDKISNSSDDKIYYPLIQPTLKEPEYKGNLLPISSMNQGNYVLKTTNVEYGHCFDCGAGNKEVESTEYIKCGKCNKRFEGDGKLRVKGVMKLNFIIVATSQ